MSKKEEIIIAAHTLFAQKGYLLSMSEIAQIVNLKTQSLYSHFKKKDDIVWIALQVEINRAFSIWSKQIESTDYSDFRADLQNFFYTIINYYKDSKTLRLWRNISLIQSIELKQKCKDLIKQKEAELGRLTQKMFISGTAQHIIKSSNLEGSMILFISMIQGLLDAMLLYENEPSMDMERFIDLAWETYWEGLTR